MMKMNPPATMTSMKKTKEDFDLKRMTLLDRAAGISKEVNEAEQQQQNPPENMRLGWYLPEH